ncbi:MAG: hypothetical protein LBU87_04670, partial [Lactobacillales bacterium]|nr:hypothetical protein [Lactobacillales bacterium]
MIRKILIFTFAFVFSVQATAQVLSSADSRAKRNFRFNTKEELAAGLTEGFTDETRKARAIAAWMAFNIEKNGFRERQLIRASGAGYLADPLLPNDIFETRIGTPQEFAKLYAELAGMAGLEATIIDGYAGYRIRGYKKDPKPVYAAADAVLRMTGAQDYRFQQYEASWNAVKIKEEWKLLDVY